MEDTILNGSLYEFSVAAAVQKPLNLVDLKGRPVLIVNTASKCGFTPQYAGLEELYKEYKDKGLEIIAFPCDQFAHQEPGSDEEIAQFCAVNYGVSFPVMSKINVNGKDAHPLFVWLKNQAPGKLGKAIKWNFTKFLVSKDGKSVKRFAPNVEPAELRADIEKEL
jgi:glutathione peroxidase